MGTTEHELEVLDEGTENTEVVSTCCSGGISQTRA